MDKSQISTIVVPIDAVPGSGGLCPHAKNGLTKICARCALKNAFNLSDAESFKVSSTSKKNVNFNAEKTVSYQSAGCFNHKSVENGAGR